MSIPVDVADLHAAIAGTDRAPYLLTVSDDGRPHSVAVDVAWDGGELTVAVGRRTLANAAARTLVSLVWPPTEPSGYSLIVDADVTSATGTSDGDNVVRLRPTRAVLHRPAPGAAVGEPGNDCVTITVD